MTGMQNKIDYTDEKTKSNSKDIGQLISNRMNNQFSDFVRI